MITITDITNWLKTTFGTIDAAQVNEWITFNPKEPILFNTAFFLGLFFIVLSYLYSYDKSQN